MLVSVAEDINLNIQTSCRLKRRHRQQAGTHRGVCFFGQK